jgi:hypothetical protein
MTRDEGHRSQRELERRLLAGERKADIVAAVAAEGGDWQRAARQLAQLPTASNRRRCRALNVALIALLALAAAGEILGLLAYDHGVWVVLDLVFPVLFLVAAALVAGYRARGYTMAATVAVVRLGWWALSVAIHHLVSAPAGLIAAQVVVCAAVAVLAVVVQRRLLPASTWTSLAPLTDAEGKWVFEE